jgi:hypothetical protein
VAVGASRGGGEGDDALPLLDEPPREPLGIVVILIIVESMVPTHL